MFKKKLYMSGHNPLQALLQFDTIWLTAALKSFLVKLSERHALICFKVLTCFNTCHFTCWSGGAALDAMELLHGALAHTWEGDAVVHNDNQEASSCIDMHT